MLGRHVQVNQLEPAAAGSLGCRFGLLHLLFSLLLAAAGCLWQFQAYAWSASRIEAELGQICKRDQC